MTGNMICVSRTFFSICYEGILWCREHNAHKGATFITFSVTSE